MARATANPDREGAGQKELPPDAAAPKLALVTYEGDRIYGYQLVTLQKSDDNQISIPLTMPMAPIFRVSIALMDGHQFHEADEMAQCRARFESANQNRAGKI